MNEGSGAAPAPLVSIGMGAFNGEQYIRKSIDSLLAQTFTDFELIISDDASTDATETICRQYAAKDSRIRYIRQNVNLGVPSNYKFLLEEARGVFFFWNEDNDLRLPNFVEECLAVMSSERSIGFVMPRHRITSRFSPLCNRLYRPDFQFVSKEDAKDRVLFYSSLSNHTHKDDLCYAFWKITVLQKILRDMAACLGKVVIGGAMNYYALSLYKGGYIDQALWTKTYRYLPPGHLLNPIVGNIARFWRSVRGERNFVHKRNSPQHHPEDWPSRAEHVDSVATLLRLAGLEEQCVQTAIATLQ